MIEILTLALTAVIAIASIRIAFVANQIAQRSVRLEADKQVMDWASRCLTVCSETCALRMSGEEEISEAEFKDARRKLRAHIYALADEGALYFHKGGISGGVRDKTIDALYALADATKPMNFKPPQEVKFAARNDENQDIRTTAKAFVEAVQTHLGSEWVR